MTSSPVQLSLFDASNQRIFASVCFVPEMKAALRAMVKASGLSREQVVDAMNAIIAMLDGKGLAKGNKRMSLATLEKWLADAERAQLPDLWGLHVLMLAMGGNINPLETWLNFYGCGVMDECSRKKVELMDLELERERRDKRRRELKQELTEK